MEIMEEKEFRKLIIQKKIKKIIKNYMQEEQLVLVLGEG